MASHVLVAEGDPSTRMLLETAIAKLGLHSRSVGGGTEALSAAEDEDAQKISLAIVDLQMPGFDGLQILRSLRKAISAPIIVLAEGTNAASVQEAFDAGASDFVIKPITHERIAVSVRNALRIRALEGEIARITRGMDGRFGFADIFCNSPEMNRAVILGRRAADLDLPVLIEGETGTGKEFFAKAIHGDSARTGRPFIAIHHADPASAAHWSHRESFLENAWAEAEGGVLYFEEIGEMPLAVQETLVQLLGIGDPSRPNGVRKGNVRLICTTSQNLIERVRAGQFREDLYYRINVFPIWLPALRNRLEDLEQLVNHFLKQFAADEGKCIDGIEKDALDLLKTYSWPGNIRQLENAVYRAVALAEGNKLAVSDFPQIAASMHAAVGPIPPAPQLQAKCAYEGPAMIGGEELLGRTITLAAANGPALGIPVLGDDGEVRKLVQIEADMIRLALGHYRGHITEVARRLGIGRSTLYRKMREFGLEMRHN